MKKERILPIDVVVGKLSALGVPGIVLLGLVKTSSFFGAAAITSSLALLGGPLGMIGGVGALLLLGAITPSVTKHGFKVILRGVIKNLNNKGMSHEQIIETIKGYPISNKLKSELIKSIES